MHEMENYNILRIKLELNKLQVKTTDVFFPLTMTGLLAKAFIDVIRQLRE